jgi:hypothetical protein
MLTRHPLHVGGERNLLLGEPRRVAAALAQATAEGQAIEPWQVEIQQHQVVGKGLHQLLQGGLDQGIVLHHQHLHGSCGLSSPP